ncbi:hypothetical protein C1S81_20625 [Mycolicibacterium neoaurum]|nr:hypothetical protein C1S81_20625 [Mycolicibacterium neoaurum]
MPGHPAGWTERAEPQSDRSRDTGIGRGGEGDPAGGAAALSDCRAVDGPGRPPPEACGFDLDDMSVSVGIQIPAFRCRHDIRLSEWILY